MAIAQSCYRILEEISRTIDSADMTATPELLDVIGKAKRVFVTGAGRSGLMMRSFAMRLMQIGVDTYVVGETTTPQIERGDVLVVGSGSGQTGGPVSFANIARHAGGRVVAITAAAKSPLRELAEIVVTLPAPTPKSSNNHDVPPSVQPLGSLFEQMLLIYVDALIIMLMETMGVDADTLMSRHTRLE